MNTIASEAHRTDTRRTDARWFYVWMAVAFTVIAFVGFTPTYWARLVNGTFTGAPILHIHAFIFYSWTLLFLAQAMLVATGRTFNHRGWGLLGIALATAMVFTVVLASINSMKLGDSLGMGDAARRFSIVQFSTLVPFVIFFVLAIVNIRRPDLHKRLMVLAMIPLMSAAMARIFMLFLAPPGAMGPPPVIAALPPALAVDLLVVVAIVHDWRTRGRPHPVYLFGGAFLLLQQILSVPIGASDAWMNIARCIQSLAG